MSEGILHPPAPAVVAEPVGVTYCITHHGLREADEGRGCAWQGDEPFEVCQFVELYRGAGYIPRALPKVDQVKLAGNAVTPPVMQWIVGRIIQALETH